MDVAWAGYVADEHPALSYILSGSGMAHSESMQSYLTMMGVRLLEIHRVLKPTGSMYLHCDPTASHYLKQLLDAIFGPKNFRNELIWHYGGRGAKAKAKQFPRNHDVLLYYSKGKKNIYSPVHVKEQLLKGYQIDNKGRAFKTSPRGDYTDESIQRLEAEGRIYRTKTGKIRIKYFLERIGERIYDYKLVGSVWNIPDMMHAPKSERVGYPTQKPLALLERIIKASSNPGDFVLDPFAGCATACVAAERLERQWVGIDLSPKAVELVNERLRQEMGDLFHFGFVTARDDIPQRTDIAALKNYRTHKHVLYGEQEGRCAGCKVHFEFRNLTVDHIVPRKRGGTDHKDNLQLLCGHCNSVKGDRPMAYLLAQLANSAVVI